MLKPRWQGKSIVIGTASDPYELAGDWFGISRKILKVLAEIRNPTYITTKGMLVKKDLGILMAMSKEADARGSFSIGTSDDNVWRQMEPGAPSPKTRMEAVGYLAENGISCGIMVAPLLPWISDGPRNIDDVIEMAAQ